MIWTSTNNRYCVCIQSHCPVYTTKCRDGPSTFCGTIVAWQDSIGSQVNGWLSTGFWPMTTFDFLYYILAQLNYKFQTIEAPTLCYFLIFFHREIIPSRYSSTQTSGNCSVIKDKSVINTCYRVSRIISTCHRVSRIISTCYRVSRISSSCHRVSRIISTCHRVSE